MIHFFQVAQFMNHHIVYYFRRCQHQQAVEVEIKYEGYIKKELAEAARFGKLEEKKLPADIDYYAIKGIRAETQQKLTKFRPESIGQASRISGVSPADISVLLIYLETYGRNKEEK